MINIRFLLSFLLNKINLNTDIFITSFKIIHSAKTIILYFINYFINHILIRSNQDLKYYKLDLFIYITLERYISDEFYEIMIDIRAFKQSIIKYRQYFAFKKNITLI